MRRAVLLPFLVAAILVVGVAWGMSREGQSQLVILAATIPVLVAVLLAGKYRFREVVIWIALLIAVLNFTPAFFNPRNLNNEALWSKALKDVPLVLCLLVGFASTSSSSRLSAPVLVLAAVVAWEVVAAPQSAAGAFVSIRYYILYPLVGLGVSRMALTEEERHRTYRVVVWLGVAEGVLAVAEFFGAVGNTLFHHTASIGAGSRSIGTLGNPDNLGLYLGFPMLVLLAALETRELFSKRRAMALLLAVLGGITSTLSKAAPVAIAGGFIFQTRRVSGRRRILFAAVLLAGFFLLATRGRGENRPNFLGSRTETDSAAFHEWTASPRSFFLGEGIGSQAHILGDRVDTGTATDNIVLTIGLDGGLLLVLAFGVVVWSAVRILHGVQGLDACLYGYGVFFLLYTPIYNNFRLYPAAFLFWMAVGLAETATREARAKRSLGTYSLSAA